MNDSINKSSHKHGTVNLCESGALSVYILNAKACREQRGAVIFGFQAEGFSLTCPASQVGPWDYDADCSATETLIKG